MLCIKLNSKGQEGLKNFLGFPVPRKANLVIFLLLFCFRSSNQCWWKHPTWQLWRLKSSLYPKNSIHQHGLLCVLCPKVCRALTSLVCCSQWLCQQDHHHSWVLLITGCGLARQILHQRLSRNMGLVPGMWRLLCTTHWARLLKGLHAEPAAQGLQYPIWQ